MKVKILSSEPHNCGIGVYSQKLIAGLKKYGVSVKEVYIKPSLNPFYYIKKLKECAFGSDIIHIQFDYPFFGNIHGLFPGIYIPLFYPALWLVQRYKFKTQSNVITSMHEVIDLKECKLKPYYWLLNHIVSKCSDIIIVFSKEAKDRLITQNVPEEKIKQITHGILIDPIFYRKEDAKTLLGFDSTDRVVTILGFIHENKGHDLIVEEFKEVNAKLFIVGDVRLEEHKSYLERLKNRVKELGIEDKVIFFGYAKNEEMPIILSATDVMVLPYRKIMQSGVLNLALAYHIPTIVSGLPYFRELKEKYGCVYISNNLSEDINHLLNDNNLQEELKNKAGIYAEKNSYKSTIFQTYMTYLEMVEAEHPDEMYNEKSQKERVGFLIKNTIPSDRMIEIGCATGYILDKVCESFGIGVDIRKDRLLLAKSKYPHLNFILASGNKLPFKANSFDTILLPDILEHVNYEFAKSIVKECKRVAKKILITVPNVSSKWVENPEHKWRPNRELVSDLTEGIIVSETKDFIYGVI